MMIFVIGIVQDHITQYAQYGTYRIHKLEHFVIPSVRFPTEENVIINDIHHRPFYTESHIAPTFLVIIYTFKYVYPLY